jgi:hypothetical protein
MKQRAGRTPLHPAIAVRGARHDAFKQAEHALHPSDAIESGDEMHFARAGIGKAGLNS